MRIGVQRNLPWLICQGSAGSEVETRHLHRIVNLGGTSYSANAGISCPLQSFSNKASLGATLKAGFEQARFDRPGGNNRSAEFSVRYEHALSNTSGLQATWQMAHTGDLSGYSPLLEYNASRRLQRQALSLALRQTLSPTWEALLNVEYFQQRSNLPLFDQQGSVVTFGLARRFN